MGLDLREQWHRSLYALEDEKIKAFNEGIYNITHEFDS